MSIRPTIGIRKLLAGPLVVAALGAGVLPAGERTGAWDAPDETSPAHEERGHPARDDDRIRYFGLTGTCERAATIPEVAPFTNLCTIALDDPRLLVGTGGHPALTTGVPHHAQASPPSSAGDTPQGPGPADDPAASPFLDELEDRGLELILSLHEVFFQTEGDGRGELHPEPERRWERAISGRERAIREAGAVALLADEPLHNGIAPADVNRVHEIVDRTFPHLITAISLSSQGVAYWLGDEPYAPDAISYHHYRILDPNAPGDAYMAAMDTIRAVLPQRPLFIVVDAWSSPAHQDLGIMPDMMDEVAERYRRRCEEEPNCIGMVGFTWTSFAYVTGLRDLPPEVQRTYHRIGAEITGKPPVPDHLLPQHALMLGDGYTATVEVVTPSGVRRTVARPTGETSGRFALDTVVAGLVVDIDGGEWTAAWPVFTTPYPAVLRIYVRGSSEPFRTIHWHGAVHEGTAPFDTE